jgi:hypothetical protein
MIEALVLPVGDRPIRKKRGEAPFATFQQRRISLNVEISLLLPGKTRVRQVLGRGAAADRDIDRSLRAFAQLVIGGEDFPLKRLRERCASYLMADRAFF